MHCRMCADAFSNILAPENGNAAPCVYLAQPDLGCNFHSCERPTSNTGHHYDFTPFGSVGAVIGHMRIGFNLSILSLFNLNCFGSATIPRILAEDLDVLGNRLAMDCRACLAPPYNLEDFGTEDRANTAPRT